MRVLGLDPGIRNTGWAIVDQDRDGAYVVTSGVIETAKGRLAEKRATIAQKLRHIDCGGVHMVAVETQVRWVGLAVAWATCCALPDQMYWQPRLEHVSAREAKASVGVPPKAGKCAVALAVESVLGFKAPTQHEADAAAVAHAAWLRFSKR